MNPGMRLVLSSLAVLAFHVSPCRADSRVTLVAGGGTDAEGPAAKAELVGPFGVDFGRDGSLYVVEMTGERFLKIDPSGNLARVGGTLRKKGNAGDGGPATQALFNDMHSLAVGPDGLVYLADTANNRVRRYNPKTGVVSAFAGTGAKGDDGEGVPALKAKFGGVYCLSFDPKGEHLYLADLDMRRVRAIDMKTGVVSTVAGNGKKGVPEDGADARTAPLLDPRAVAADGAGNVYVLERGGHALRVVGADGKIRTVVGTGKAGAAGDGGDARRATLNGPKHLCVDRDGSVLIADTENHLIRRYLPREGKIVRVAGTGKKGAAGVGGPPEKAELAQPHGVIVHPSGAIYVSDSGNDRVLRIER